MIRHELRRAFGGLEFKIALAFGIIIAVIQYCIMVLPAVKDLAFAASEEMIPHSVFSKWMGADLTSFAPALYFTVLPIICTLPFGESYYRDLQSGYARQMSLLHSRRKYLVAKYVAVFLSAGAVIVLPLVLNLYMAAVTLPSIKPVLAVGYFPLNAATRFMPYLPYQDPYLYTAVYLCIIFLFSGGIATLALAVAPFANNRFVVYILPFAFVGFLGVTCSFFGFGQFNAANFLQPAQPANGVTWGSLGAAFLVMAVLPALVYFLRGRNSDIF